LCSESLVRFLSIRVISDDAHADLPREVARVIAHGGSYRVGAALRAVWQRPSSIKDFWGLYEHAIEASARLATFVMSCLPELCSFVVAVAIFLLLFNLGRDLTDVAIGIVRTPANIERLGSERPLLRRGLRSTLRVIMVVWVVPEAWASRRVTRSDRI